MTALYSQNDKGKKNTLGQRRLSTLRFIAQVRVPVLRVHAVMSKTSKTVEVSQGKASLGKRLIGSSPRRIAGESPVKWQTGHVPPRHLEARRSRPANDWLDSQLSLNLSN